jgi:hypothetical protein
MPKGAMRKIYTISASVGLIGGFLMAYQDSSSGWIEIITGFTTECFYREVLGMVRKY